MGPSHSSPTVVFHTLDRTTKQDSSLRTGLPNILCDILYRIGHIVFLAHRLDHIFSMVRLLLDHHTCLRCLSVRPSECSLGTDSEVLQKHGRPAGM